MTFAITLLSLVGAGLALLRLWRLGTGSAPADVALAWLVGSGAFAAAAPLVRFGLRVPLSRGTVLALVLLPPIAWGVELLRRRRAPAAEGSPASVPAANASPRSRWIPRPTWLFVPIALYVVVIAGAALLHGVNTPTHTDDGVRVRAFASMLAFADGWASEARGIFVMAGALPTFVPALGWIVAGTIDHFHVNYCVLAELVALLVLAVSVGSSRGRPERGWAAAFAVLSVPLFVYHCTSTYSDAVLAMRVAGGLLFTIEYARTRARSDATRALLLLGLATLVKREGELVAAAPAAVLLVQLAWERHRGSGPFPWRAPVALAGAVVLGALGKIAAVGLANAFPMLGFVAQQSAAATAETAARAPGTGAAAAVFFELALFRSGNAGMIYWVLAAAIVVRGRALLRSRLAWPLAAIAALLGEVAVSSILLVPEYTLDQSTVHRALLVASVPAALWLAAAVTDAAREETAEGTGRAAARPEPATPLTPQRRRRRRPASRS